MSDNKAFRAMLAFLIARDHAHQKAWAKALETMGVKWSEQIFPIPHIDLLKGICSFIYVYIITT